MSKCLFCYQSIEAGEYHENCSKRFFGTSVIPQLELDQVKLKKLAELTVDERLAVTGVQPKLSLTLAGNKGEKRLTLVGLWGDYILKPQSNEYLFMPENEDLTMHLAQLFKIKTADHTLIRTSQGDLVYITKRFDRKKGQKIHVEDLCQLSELLTEQKYNSSYERVGKVISTHASNSGLDVINYFKLVLFSFLTGNNDMHLKNFSLMHTDDGILLSPAYDLLNVNLVFPKDVEDLALSLSGRKKKITKNDFDQFALSLNIDHKVKENIFKKFSLQFERVVALIKTSFLPEEQQENYIQIVTKKFKQIGLGA